MESAERWLALEVRAPAGGDASARRRRVLTEVLVAATGAGVEERSGWLRAYLTAPDDPAEAVADVRRSLAEALDGSAPELRWRWIEGRDWGRAWRRGLEPRRVGHRIVVAPSWTDPDADPEDVVVRLDPGMAFGTGEHASTRGALRLLERAIEPGARVLDVGTGSGILAIAAALLGARRVVAVDREPDAVRAASENAARNDVGGRVDVVRLEVAPSPLRLMAPPSFDLVVANLLASVVGPLLAPLRGVAGDEGRLIAGGILGEEAAEVIAAARRAGWSLEARDREAGWWTGVFRPAGRGGSDRPRPTERPARSGGAPEVGGLHTGGTGSFRGGGAAVLLGGTRHTDRLP